MADPEPAFAEFRNGDKAPLAFAESEYLARLAWLRQVMARAGITAVTLTSEASIAYLSGLVRAGAGSALIVTATQAVVTAPRRFAGRSWRRSAGDVLAFAGGVGDLWQAVAHVAGTGQRVGIEADAMTLTARAAHDAALQPTGVVDMADALRQKRARKSAAEVALLREVARTADVGAYAVKDAIRIGVREVDAAWAGRAAVEAEVARSFPDAEITGTQVAVSSGISTDSSTSESTTRVLELDVLIGARVAPMIHGYTATLGRTLALGEVPKAAMENWAGGSAALALAAGVLRPGGSLVDAERQLVTHFGDGGQSAVPEGVFGPTPGLPDPTAADLEDSLAVGMTFSFAPTRPAIADTPSAGGLCDADAIVITEGGAEALSGYPIGPDFNRLD